MDSETELQQIIVRALPLRFAFYNMGEVELQQETTPIDEDVSAISYRMYGDVKSLLIVLFPKGLDLSLYAELGNVIASKIATQLSSDTSLDVMVSPPQILNEVQTQKLRLSQEHMIRRNYAHLYSNSLVQVETLILFGALEETGYA